MAPDINSLPPSTHHIRLSPAMSSPLNNGDALTAANNGGGLSPSSSSSPRASTSLQATATLNAGLQRGDSVSTRTSSPGTTTRTRQPSTSGRRRSQVLMNLQLADPHVPSPGEMIAEPHGVISAYRTSPQLIPLSPSMTAMGDPHHNRTPSLGELHQELENEQEFQVNRLLQEIHRLQLLLQMQRQQQQNQSAVITGDEPSEGPGPLHITTAQTIPIGPRSPISAHPRSSFDMARVDLQRRSRTPSRGASPRIRSTSISGESNEQWVLGSRDESAFYQAETQMLIRENQMLRHRIRDLEKQLSELIGTATSASITHEPSHSSQLYQSTSTSDEESSRPAAPATSQTAADTSKEE